MQGASPCRDFQVTHSRSDRQQPVDMTHTAVQLPDLTHKNRKGGVSADSELGRQTWLVRLRASGSISLWIGGDGSSDRAVRATVQVCAACVQHAMHHILLYTMFAQAYQPSKTVYA